MRAKLFDIECSNCKSKWVIKADSVINDDFEKSYYDKIMDHSFFARKCSACGNIIEFVYPLIYHYPKYNTIVALEHPTLEVSQSIVYQASTIDSFCELLMIVKYGLKVEVIEDIKKKLKNYDTIRFDSYENNHIFFETNKGSIAIEYKK